MTQTKEIGVGMLGYAFMGKAHTNAFKKLPYMYYPPPAIPVLKGICGRNESAVQEATERFGYQYGTTEWQKIVDDTEIEIFDNNGPNNVHMEPCIAALEAGKHTIVEKPLALDVAEARKMVAAAEKAAKNGIKNMVSFSNRFSPAVLLARRLIREGKLGHIYHFRAAFLQDWLLSPDFPLAWRLKKEVAGSGVLGDLNAHSIDMARFLTGLESWKPAG
jgi:predicted dehydrogenase